MLRNVTGDYVIQALTHNSTDHHPAFGSAGFRVNKEMKCTHRLSCQVRLRRVTLVLLISRLKADGSS